MATGDYHDFFLRPDGQTAVFVGDATGHGPAASMLVATMRAIFRTHPDRHSDPGQTLSFAGRTLSGLTSTGEFMTGVYLVLASDGRVAWASAGHDPPLRVSRDGQVAPVDLTPVGLPLGIEASEEYAMMRWEVGPGERLLLFTDGLVEASNGNGEAFGRARLRSIISDRSDCSLGDLVRTLVVRSSAHAGGVNFADDITIVGVERTGFRAIMESAGQVRNL
jgi:sigma-B regulation protein RsbU (phosphoserine phosphatase)